MATSPTIRRCWNGRALVEAGDTLYLAGKIEIDVYQRLGIVQAGANGKYIPEQQLAIDESYCFAVGNYEVTVTRRKAKRPGDSKIISLSSERKKRVAK